MKIQDPHLGTLDFDEAGMADTILLVNGAEIDVAVELGEEPSREQIERATARVAQLAELESAARAAMLTELDHGEEDTAAVIYWSHHRAELGEKEIESVFGVDSAADVSHALFLKALHVVAMAIAPGSEDCEISLDYSIGRDVTDYVLVVRFGSDGQVSVIDLES